MIDPNVSLTTFNAASVVPVEGSYAEVLHGKALLQQELERGAALFDHERCAEE